MDKDNRQNPSEPSYDLEAAKLRVAERVVEGLDAAHELYGREVVRFMLGVAGTLKPEDSQPAGNLSGVELSDRANALIVMLNMAAIPGEEAA